MRIVDEARDCPEGGKSKGKGGKGGKGKGRSDMFVRMVVTVRFVTTLRVIRSAFGWHTIWSSMLELRMS